MDENAYRSALSSTNPQPCPFEKSILTRCVACSQAGKRNIAEREAVVCNDSASRVHCITLHEFLREKFTFALHRKTNQGPLPHAQEMRVQCGGLKGLQSVLDGNAQVGDVSDLLSRSLQAYGNIDGFPYFEIVHWTTANYKYRGSTK